ncbi:MAG TPA: hypothetical protein VGK32_15370 [Vicinamibacterales bacterium]|jgi:quercetin dioxygenase-like cupin family protein
MDESKSYPVPFVLIRRALVEQDGEPAENKLGTVGNNGRKVLATRVLPEFGEVEVTRPQWTVPAVLPTGDGGLEVATFTEFAGQDRHKHLRSTEIYTVLRGRLSIYIDDEPHVLDALDEVVILPGTVHEVVQDKRRSRGVGEAFELLVRVHALSCFGVDDKYVQFDRGGAWHRWSELTREARARAYKRQGDPGS